MTSTGSTKPHIRPRVRSRAKTEQAAAKETKETKLPNENDDLDRLLEETRGRLSSRLIIDEPKGVSISNEVIDSTMYPPISVARSGSNDAPAPASILKKPKYSNNNATSTAAGDSGDKNDSSAALTLIEELKNAAMEEAQPQTSTKRVVRDFVVERDPSQVKAQPMPQGAMDPRAVEGYTPQMEDNDIVISSLAELMEKAGIHPDQESDDPKVVEANLQFSVMSAQQFEDEQKQQEEEEQELLEQPPEVFQGRFNVFSDDDDSDGSYMQQVRPEDGDDYWSDSDNDHIEEMPPAEPRAFMKIWDALSEWITPEAVAMLMEWNGGEDGTDAVMEMSHGEWAPIVDTSEIAASRCSGLMALLNMHLQRGLKDLDQPLDVDRGAKRRLADLLRTFNYSRVTARLDTKMWRAMTCVLLDMVLALKNDKSSEPPASAKAIGITPDEYYYLTQTCFRSLAAGSRM